MRDVKARLERLLVDAEDCEIIGRLATVPAKRETFRRLAETYRAMAKDLEALLASGDIPGDLGI